MVQTTILNILTLCLIGFRVASIAGQKSEVECGKYDLEPEQSATGMGRISGGVDAPKMVPWMVGLETYKKVDDPETDPEADDDPAGENLQSFKCGGTILDRWNIITAAHCFWPRDRVRSVKVMVGWYLWEDDMNLPADSTPEQRNKSFQHDFQNVVANADTILLHQDYDKEANTNDLALLRLPRPLKLSKKPGDNRAFPACLPTDDDSIDNVNTEDCLAFGWGLMCAYRKVFPTALQMSRMKIIDRETCGISKARRASQYCVAGHQRNGGNSSCGGDSGAGLVCRKKKSRDKFVLVGVLSGGQGNCSWPDKRSVFTRLTHFLKWIARNKKTGRKKRPTKKPSKEEEERAIKEDDLAEWRREEERENLERQSLLTTNAPWNDNNNYDYPVEIPKKRKPRKSRRKP